MVKGQGTTESMRIAGKLPGMGSSLRFKITEALLKDCTESEYSMGTDFLKPSIKTMQNYISERNYTISIILFFKYKNGGWVESINIGFRKNSSTNVFLCKVIVALY